MPLIEWKLATFFNQNCIQSVMEGILKRYAFIELGILLVVAFYAIFPPMLVLTVWKYAGLSFIRMLLAYILSLIFSILYGLYAATNKRAERILIPVLDILQSIPILGFFPLAIFILIMYLPSGIGAELASIILIFTSQAWNMAFGVYESITTIPDDPWPWVLHVGNGGQGAVDLRLPCSWHANTHNCSHGYTHMETSFKHIREIQV